MAHKLCTKFGGCTSPDRCRTMMDNGEKMYCGAVPDLRAEMGATPIPIVPGHPEYRETVEPRGNSLPEDDAKRGLYPMADGCLDYFPNALAEVSRISYEGNEKHNPGKPMHWARGKSTDHRNKIIRHTVDSLPETEVAIEHAAQAAWRALAYLQEKIERVRNVQVSGASR
jgi:hypothetical protein